MNDITSPGHDAALILHLNHRTWEESLAAAEAAQELLEQHGYLVTRKPTLPHSPLSTPDEIQAFMESGPS